MAAVGLLMLKLQENALSDCLGHLFQTIITSGNNMSGVSKICNTVIQCNLELTYFS